MKATIITRDIPQAIGPMISCPECGGKNKIPTRNTKCTWCGFTLRVELYPTRENYVRGLGATASGRDTYDINDGTAADLRGLDENEVINTTAKELAELDRGVAFSKKVGRDFGKDTEWGYVAIQNFLFERYEDRNPGMIRMNCGNILRAAKKRADQAANGIA